MRIMEEVTGGKLVPYLTTTRPRPVVVIGVWDAERELRVVDRRLAVRTWMDDYSGKLHVWLETEDDDRPMVTDAVHVDLLAFMNDLMNMDALVARLGGCEVSLHTVIGVDHHVYTVGVEYHGTGVVTNPDGVAVATITGLVIAGADCQRPRARLLGLTGQLVDVGELWFEDDGGRILKAAVRWVDVGEVRFEAVHKVGRIDGRCD